MHQNIYTLDVCKPPMSPWWWHLRHAEICRRFTNIRCVYIF